MEHPVDGVFDIGTIFPRSYHINFLLHRFLEVGRGSSVGITTRYGLD